MIGLLEFLSIGRSEEESLLGPDDESVGTLVVLDAVLLALSRVDCLHLFKKVIVEIKSILKKEFIPSASFDYHYKINSAVMK